MTISVPRSSPVFFFAVLGFISSAAAIAEEASSDLSLSLGYRVDSLDWNIADGASGPNILSELEWRDLDILQLKAEMVSSNNSGIVFRGNAGYGWVLDGINQDSDYAGDNRTQEFSRSHSDVDGSRMLDLSGGLGYTFYMGESDQHRIIPMLGLAYHNQDMRMTNGIQIVPATGPFAGLNSSYDAEWFGPWVGVDLATDLASGGALYARIETHWVNYFAQANWNLRSAFAHPVSFEHEANGRGNVLELGWQSEPKGDEWAWGASMMIQSWTTDPGIDRVFFSDNTFYDARLNEVNWSSRSINLSLRKPFAP